MLRRHIVSVEYIVNIKKNYVSYEICTEIEVNAFLDPRMNDTKNGNTPFASLGDLPTRV